MIARAALVALAMTAALASAGEAAQDDRAVLDGQRATSHSYDGTLAGPSVYTGVVSNDWTSNGLDPQPSWCNPQTCDNTPLRLMLPAGRKSGRLVVELTEVAPTASMHFVVYNDKNEALPGQEATCCAAPSFVAARLPAGEYRVIVYNDAGSGSFEISITWTANRPHRSSPTG